MSLKNAFLILLFVFAALNARSVEFKSPGKPLSLGKHLYFLEDKTGQLSIEEIASPEFKDKFTQNNSDVLSLGFSDSIYWIRFTIKNKQSTNEKLLLEAGFPLIRNLVLYMPQGDGRFIQKQAGYIVPFKNRDFIYHNFVFLLSAFEESAFYIRMESPFAKQLFLNLWVDSAFFSHSTAERFIYGLFYGIMIAIIIYNLFIFVSTRDLGYGCYAGFLISAAATLQMMNGFFPRLAPFGLVVWLIQRMPLAVNLAILLGSLFIRHVLETDRNFPKYDKLMKALTFSSILLILYSLAGVSQLCIILTFFITAAAAVVNLGAIILGALKRIRIAYTCIAAFTPLIIGVLIVSLGFYGVLPVSYISNNAVQIGITFSALIFSIGLADLINFNTNERERYALELDQKNKALIEEISEKKQTEENLAKSERKYRQIFENAQAPYVELSMDGILQEISPSISEYSLYQRDELIGKSVIDFFKGKKTGEKILRGVSRSNEPVNLEIELLDKDGKTKNVLASVRSVPEEQKIVGSILDISERKRAEKEVLSLERQLHNIFNAIPSIIVSVDTEGRIVNWNQQAEKKKGISNESAKGLAFVDVFPEYAAQWGKIEAAMRMRQTKEESRILRSEDGKLYYDSIAISPLVDEEVEGAVIRIDDVTDKVQMNEIMVQTEKMMSVGGLAAGMAHELNNPLGGILQGAQNVLRRFSLELKKNVQIASETNVDLHQMQSYLEKRGIISILDGIQESGKKAAKIINNMLQFSRKSNPELVPTDIKNLMDRVIDLAGKDYNLKKKFDFRKIKIVKEFDSALKPVPCIEIEIEQVLLNLMSNAAWAMAAHTEKIQPQITLRAKIEKGIVRIEVEDNGPGIDEQIRKRIFEPFYTTKPVGEGTGLGLSVAYMIITNNHGGDLEVQSEPGKGARFIIKLPLDRS